MKRSIQHERSFPLYRKAVRLAVGMALLGTVGCAEKTPDDSAAAKAPSVSEITDDDCRAFAKDLEEAARSGNIDAFNRAIDWDAILARATTPPEGSKEFNRLFISVTMRDLAEACGLAARVADSVKNGGEFRCLRIHAKGGSKRAVFRLMVPQKSSLDYFEFEIVRRSDGTVAASDYYTFRTGEMVSQTVCRQYRFIAPSASKAVARISLTPKDLSIAENNRKISDMQISAHAGDGRRALDIYAELPVALQNDKTVLLTRLDAANLLGGRDYEDAMQAIQSALPGDPCLDFVLVDYYLFHNEYEKLRAAIDRIDLQIGGDSYQDARRALSYMQEKNYKLAREYAQKALQAEDSLLLPYCVLLQSALEERQFDEVSRLLTVMTEKSLMTFPDLTTIPVYAEFVKSPEYQKWLKMSKQQ